MQSLSDPLCLLLWLYQSPRDPGWEPMVPRLARSFSSTLVLPTEKPGSPVSQPGLVADSRPHGWGWGQEHQLSPSGNPPPLFGPAPHWQQHAIFMILKDAREKEKSRGFSKNSRYHAVLSSRVPHMSVTLFRTASPGRGGEHAVEPEGWGRAGRGGGTSALGPHMVTGPPGVSVLQVR